MSQDHVTALPAFLWTRLHLEEKIKPDDFWKKAFEILARNYKSINFSDWQLLHQVLLEYPLKADKNCDFLS